MPPVWTLPMLVEQPSSLNWEMLNSPILPIFAEPPAERRKPLTEEEIDSVVQDTSLERADYIPVLRLSPAVPTTNTLPTNQWRVQVRSIFSFDPAAANDTSNQNYSTNLDIGLSNNLLLSAFVTRADNTFSAQIKGSDGPISNLWQSYGGAVRWRWFHHEAWAAAFNASLEVWDVSSGGGSAFTSLDTGSSSNIFNDSDQRVSTRNLIGASNITLSWQPNSSWYLSLVPGVSFLPANQGAQQGGVGEFYGTNFFVSTGVLFQPIPEIGLTATVLHPMGRGTNSFDSDLAFSRVPILSAGLNWDLNPRIGFRGLFTNGFGATPATALLTFPSANRFGYSANFVFTPDAPDTPQVPLSNRQRALAQGGLTVNTALVPPGDMMDFWVDADSNGNISNLFGYSISNVFQFQLESFLYNKSFYPSLRANRDSFGWRIGGKAIALSPLRGAPFWGAGRITLGLKNALFGETRQVDNDQDHVFSEVMATWEISPNYALTLNPKIAISKAGQRLGIGIGSNLELAHGLQLIIEGNAAINNPSNARKLVERGHVPINNSVQNNATLGIRWQFKENLVANFYCSSTISMLNVGQIFTSHQLRFGTRLMASF